MIEARRTAWTDARRPGQRIAHAIEVHETIGSTNDRVRELLEHEEGEGVVVVAEEQTGGRGRLGRTWTSPAGRNLTMSVGVRPRLAAAEAWTLGLAVALAVRAACGRLAPVELKWPNDLVAPDGRKLGGLLIETSVQGDRVQAAIIGIGINVNWPRSAMPPELSAATSLEELTGGEVDRVALLGAVADRLEAELLALESGRSPLARYRAACSTLGAEVIVETGEGRVEGRARAIDERGSLVIETAGTEVAVASGEVRRVRGGARS
jgi:BirA family transcriptional regulator, biotin operon repressor / biotin---[acetyl-CoA-carboxylase] ligase